QPGASANITPLPLTVHGITAANKVYDSTTAVTLTVTTPSITGIVAGDSVSLVVGSVSGAFSTKDAGVNKSVALSELSLTGPRAAEFTRPPLIATITPAPLTLTGVAAANKTYDGTTKATLNMVGTVAIGGVLPADSVTVTFGSLTGTFANKNVASNISVSI